MIARQLLHRSRAGHTARSAWSCKSGGKFIFCKEGRCAALPVYGYFVKVWLNAEARPRRAMCNGITGFLTDIHQLVLDAQLRVIPLHCVAFSFFQLLDATSTSVGVISRGWLRILTSPIKPWDAPCLFPSFWHSNIVISSKVLFVQRSESK